jgi:hypothetical protein
MARWSLQRRLESRRSLNTNTPAALAPGEVRYRRIELAVELLELALHDDPRLPDPVHQTLQRLYNSLSVVREEARRLA